MHRRSWRWRCFTAFLVLFSGVLMQTSCASVALEMTTGLSTAIANQIIQNLVYQALNATSVSSLGT